MDDRWETQREWQEWIAEVQDRNGAEYEGTAPAPAPRTPIDWSGWPSLDQFYADRAAFRAKIVEGFAAQTTLRENTKLLGLATIHGIRYSVAADWRLSRCPAQEGELVIDVDATAEGHPSISTWGYAQSPDDWPSVLANVLIDEHEHRRKPRNPDAVPMWYYYD